jgi:hypothetical protein
MPRPDTATTASIYLRVLRFRRRGAKSHGQLPTAWVENRVLTVPLIQVAVVPHSRCATACHGAMCITSSEQYPPSLAVAPHHPDTEAEASPCYRRLPHSAEADGGSSGIVNAQVIRAHRALKPDPRRGPETAPRDGVSQGLTQAPFAVDSPRWLDRCSGPPRRYGTGRLGWRVYDPRLPPLSSSQRRIVSQSQTETRPGGGSSAVVARL